MTTPRDPDRLFAAWMSEGPATLRDEVLTDISVEIRRNPQRRGLGSRWARLAGPARAMALMTAAVVVVAVTGIGLLGLARSGPPAGGPLPVASPSPTPSPAASPTPGRTPVAVWTIESSAYGYRWPFAADVVSLMPTPATVPWSGTTQCIVQDACTDWIGLKGEPGRADRLVWAFGAPTDLGLDDYAADMQRRMSEWRGCPVEPDVTRSIVLDGVPARIAAFTCPSGVAPDLHVRVYAVHNGQGLVISMAKPGSSEALVAADEIDRLLGYLDAFRWAP